MATNSHKIRSTSSAREIKSNIGMPVVIAHSDSDIEQGGASEITYGGNGMQYDASNSTIIAHSNQSLTNTHTNNSGAGKATSCESAKICASGNEPHGTQNSCSSLGKPVSGEVDKQTTDHDNVTEHGSATDGNHTHPYAASETSTSTSTATLTDNPPTTITLAPSRLEQLHSQLDRLSGIRTRGHDLIANGEWYTSMGAERLATARRMIAQGRELARQGHWALRRGRRIGRRGGSYIRIADREEGLLRNELEVLEAGSAETGVGWSQDGAGVSDDAGAGVVGSEVGSQVGSRRPDGGARGGEGDEDDDDEDTVIVCEPEPAPWAAEVAKIPARVMKTWREKLGRV